MEEQQRQASGTSQKSSSCSGGGLRKSLLHHEQRLQQGGRSRASVDITNTFPVRQESCTSSWARLACSPSMLGSSYKRGCSYLLDAQLLCTSGTL